MQPISPASLVAMLIFSARVFATTYYVSPAGDDTQPGTSIDRPWKSCEKVNATTFKPGDSILFRRGSTWRSRLIATSDGTETSPINYDAYGTGDKPRIFGSALLDNSRFTPAGKNRYVYPITARADSALIDHDFVASEWADGVLTITTATDPRVDHKTYAACVRGNVIFSNRKSHLVFRNLIVDETAGQITDGAVQAYGVRIEGGADVLVEDCEAYRCGRHHFAAINTTGFTGRRLRAGYVQPNTPGDNTPFVSYADAGAPVDHCSSVWDDVAADHLDDGKGGRAVSFVSHGDHQGSITIKNSRFDTKVSLMSSPVVINHVTLRDNASVENFGVGILIDGVTLRGSSAIDQWGSDGTIQNCIANLSPAGNGPTGYSAAVVIRDKARNNTVRFNTLVTGKFSCLEIAGPDSATRWFGNIMIADGNTIAAASGKLEKTDVARADDNWYSPAATFAGKNFADWQAGGFDVHSATGDPQFVDATGGDFHLKPKSPACHRSVTTATEVPGVDADGIERPANASSNEGALERVGNSKTGR